MPYVLRLRRLDRLGGRDRQNAVAVTAPTAERPATYRIKGVHDVHPMPQSKEKRPPGRSRLVSDRIGAALEGGPPKHSNITTPPEAAEGTKVMCEADHYAVHDATGRPVRWGLTIEAAKTVLAELGADTHFINDQKIAGIATFGPTEAGRMTTVITPAEGNAPAFVDGGVGLERRLQHDRPPTRVHQGATRRRARRCRMAGWRGLTKRHVAS